MADKSSSFLKPKKVLTAEEYQQYTKNKQAIKRSQLLSENKSNARTAQDISRQESYSKTRSGKLGNLLGKFVKTARPGGVTRALYSRSIPPQQKKSVSTGKRGRPFGTLKYRDEYGNPIGVYEYRKILSARLRQQRIEAMGRATINPQQRAVLNQIEARQQAQRQNVEARPIPDTFGDVNLNQVFKDIEDSSNLVP